MRKITGLSFFLTIVVALYTTSPTVYAALDDDADGLSDVWERQYQAQELAAEDDTDQDGHTNQQESLAGTDPLDPSSQLCVAEVTWLAGPIMQVKWPTQLGKTYSLLLGNELGDTNWVNEGTPFYGTGNDMTVWLEANKIPRAFGGVTREVWNGIPGEKVSHLVNSTEYAGEPNGTHMLTNLEIADTGGSAFGARIRGWITPKESRAVIFYIAANTSAEFYFSTTDHPDDATLLCRVLDDTQPRQWQKSPFQQSLPYGVEAGKRYYFEILHKHDVGDDHVAVAWRDFDGSEIEIISSDELEPHLDTSASQSGDLLANEQLRYVAVSAADDDSDGDELTTWEENKIGALNPYSEFSKDSLKDKETIQQMFFASSDEINVLASAPNAVEKEGTPGAFRITRDGSADAITIHFTLNGDSNPARGSASPSDYELRDSGGAPLTSSIALPFGAAFVDVFVHALNDAADEVPETLMLTITPHSDYTVGTTDEARVAIVDAENSAANQRLFVGYLSPENNAETSASGIVSVLLQGDNDTARVNMSFSGLTTEQSAAHIHVSNPISGPIVQGLPLGQITDFEWPIRSAQFLSTDQEVLDALFAGQFYANVHSQEFPGGEIRGDLNLTVGSTTLQIPGNAPAITRLTDESLDHDIMRFLQQATFGPTTGLFAEVKAMIEDPNIGNGDQIAGYNAWLSQQMNSTTTPSMDLAEYTKAAVLNMTNSNPWEARRYGMWINAIYGKDQLRQRMAFALSQIFVVSDQEFVLRQSHFGMSNYYQMLVDGAFGSYENLLMDVTKHPCMGFYLSHLRNQRAVTDSEGNVIVSPDENYAREIMQLFSAGLVQLHLDGTIRLGADGLPVPTYDNNTIGEMARVFTGLSFSMYDDNGTPTANNSFFLGNSTDGANQSRWTHPMRMFDNYHDQGEKAIIRNVIIPAGLGGDVDLQVVCAVLGNHENTAPFVARRLIQRFVTSNPSKGYLYRVASRFKNTGGNLGETIKQVLLDYEARTLGETTKVSFGKPKEPVIKMIQLQRVLNPSSGLPLADLEAFGFPTSETAKMPANVSRLRYRDHNRIGQIMHNSPSVFNFFLPDFSKPGKLGLAGLVTPELQIKTESQVYDFINEIYDVTDNLAVAGDGIPDNQTDNSLDDIHFDTSYFQTVYDTAYAASGNNELVASAALIDAMDALLNASGLRRTYLTAPAPNARSLLIDSVANISNGRKVQDALYMFTISPQFSTQK